MNSNARLGLTVTATAATLLVAISLWSPFGANLVASDVATPTARSLAAAFPTAEAGFARSRVDGGR